MRGYGKYVSKYARPFRLASKLRLVGSYMNGAKSNRNEKLNNSAISFKCQVKGDDILAFSNRLKKRTYEYATPLGEMHINTHSSNVIYITA